MLADKENFASKEELSNLSCYDTLFPLSSYTHYDNITYH